MWVGVRDAAEGREVGRSVREGLGVGEVRSVCSFSEFRCDSGGGVRGLIGAEMLQDLFEAPPSSPQAVAGIF
jgi:hypothetical protein